MEQKFERSKDIEHMAILRKSVQVEGTENVEALRSKYTQFI